jgi:hypothetical protein
MSVAGAAIPALLAAIGALVVAIVAIFLRARAIERMYTTVPHWPRTLNDDDGVVSDPAARIELVERLAIVAEPWCVDTLREATKEERHPEVRKAIHKAWDSLRPRKS